MLNYSREFIVLATCLNYTKAAQMLSLSQSSLSRHISDLEKEVGFQLFERNPLALTSSGRFYLESIGGIIEQLDEVVERGRAMAQKNDQGLSIYMLPTNGLYARIVYESISKIRKLHPDFSPRFCYTDRIYSAVDAVLENKADIGIVLSEPTDIPEGFASEWLANSPVMVWLHEDNPLVKSESLCFEDIADCYLMRSTTQSADIWYEGMVDVCRRNGFEPKHRLRDLENKESFFLALRPDEVLIATDEGETECRYNSHLVGVRFDDPGLYFSVHLLYRDRGASPAVGRFVKTCRCVADELRDASLESR